MAVFDLIHYLLPQQNTEQREICKEAAKKRAVLARGKGEELGQYQCAKEPLSTGGVLGRYGPERVPESRSSLVGRY